MTPPLWVPLQAVFIIHDRQIARHGGASGLRDRGLLEQGCDRPRNKFEYEQADLITCAAAYGFGISQAHAFVDGNKRTAFVTLATFLRLNGLHVRPDPSEGVQMMEALARGDLSEAELANWLGKLAKPLTQDGA